MTKQIITTIALLSLLAFIACSNSESDFWEEPINDDTAIRIFSYQGRSKNVKIPAQIGELPVTSIGSGAFSGFRLRSVSIPNSVTYISDMAFFNNRLRSVSIPNSVTSIGFLAFANNRLTSIIIPYGVKEIPLKAFESNRLTSVIIPDSVTEIGTQSFANNQLVSITIPDSVTLIQEAAFMSNQLTSIIIPDSVTSIRAGAFAQNKITSITIGSNVPTGGPSYSGSAERITGWESFYDEANDLLYSFDNEFDDIYEENGSRAGTYTFSNGKWTFQQ
jgi:hypothetical protein